MIGGFIIIVAVAFLSYMGFRSAVTYYYEVHELLDQRSALEGQTLRVGGEVAPGAEREGEGLSLRFSLIDIADRQTTLPVLYQGAVPDTFTVGRHVIVEGTYADGVFQADRVLTKCASKYVPATEPTVK